MKRHIDKYVEIFLACLQVKENHPKMGRQVQSLLIHVRKCNNHYGFHNKITLNFTWTRF